MPPQRVARRGSMTLGMLDNQFLALQLESVLSSTNPISADAAFETVDGVLTAAIWRSHLVSLDNIALARGAHSTTSALLRLLSMATEFLPRDSGKGGPNMANLEGDEPMPGMIDVRARGRILSHGWNFAPLDECGFFSDMSDCVSCVSTSPHGAKTIRRIRTPVDQGSLLQEGGGRALESLDEPPLLGPLNVVKAPWGNRPIPLTLRDSGMVTSRSECPSTSRSFASCAKSCVQSHPAITRLFDMADRRNVGWLNVTDLQVFLLYHGHKQWATQTFIRTTLTELDILKGGNEPVKQHHFLRALTARQSLTQRNAAAAVGKSAPRAGAEDDPNNHDSSTKAWDRSSYQVSPQVSVRDVFSVRRPSTAPAAETGWQRGGRGAGSTRQQERLLSGTNRRASSRHAGGNVGKKNMEEYLALDHSVQASLVETITDVRPGVTVQEMVPKEGGTPDGLGQAEILRMKAGPVEMQVPGRLSRSAYKALSRTRTAPQLPVSLNRARREGENGPGFSHPLKGDADRLPREGGVRLSTAPLGLRGFFGANDGPDPRLLGGSKISSGDDGDDGGENDGGLEDEDGRGRTSGNVPGRDADRRAFGERDDEEEGVPPFFVGEDVGHSSIPGGVGSISEGHASLPRSARPISSSNGSTRARVSSPGLGVRGEKRGGRPVTAC